MTSATNPWNERYRTAVGRRKKAAITITMRQKDGTLTTNLQGTLLHMLQNLTSEDNPADDTELHKQIRAITQEAIDTFDDKKFTVQAVKNAVASMAEKKAPGEDGIPSEVFKSLVETIPRYKTAVYNGCLRKGMFPKRWKKQ